MKVLRCTLCGSEIMPRGELERCPETASGWHLNNVAAAHMTERQKQDRMTGLRPA